MATATAPPPSYCTSGTGIHTPSQWTTCAKLGWNAPTTGAAHAGYVAGHTGVPIFLAVIVVVLIVAALARSGARSAAPQRS